MCVDALSSIVDASPKPPPPAVAQAPTPAQAAEPKPKVKGKVKATAPPPPPPPPVEEEDWPAPAPPPAVAPKPPPPVVAKQPPPVAAKPPPPSVPEAKSKAKQKAAAPPPPPAAWPPTNSTWAKELAALEVAEGQEDQPFFEVAGRRGTRAAPPPPAPAAAPRTVPGLAPAPKPAPKAKQAAKARPAEPKGANPLPHRAPTAVPRAIIPTLSYSNDNAATSAKWMERPVERIVPTYYEEEDDPELAQYLWDRRSQRSKAPSAAAVAKPKSFASAATVSRAPPPNPARQRQLLTQVMEMGFDEPSAKRALAQSGWASVEGALAMLLG